MEAWKQELYHHGIKGQKWGVRRGPPYPLDASARSASVKRKKEPKNGKLQRVMTRADVDIGQVIAKKALILIGATAVAGVSIAIAVKAAKKKKRD